MVVGTWQSRGSSRGGARGGRGRGGSILIKIEEEEWLEDSEEKEAA
jgi:hypothetical protein